MKGISLLLIFPVAFYSCANRENKTALQPAEFRDTTEMVVKWDTVTYPVTSVVPSYNGVDLSLDLSVKNEGLDYYLHLLSQKEGWKVVDLAGGPLPTDCLYVSSQFRILNQRLVFDKEKYVSGDEMKGTVELLLLGKRPFLREPLVPFTDKRKWDTVRISGSFSAAVR